jgi:prepilin-type N-terminal cleavage/methylation domain-containing protein
MRIPSSPFHAEGPRYRRGFSLIEIAVVIAVISVLIAIVAAPLAGQIERRRIEETQKLLETAKDALHGFAAANGRLPCPATAASAGQEAPLGGGTCSAAVGFLPAATLGLTPVDNAGFAIDAWADGSAARRIGYAVSQLPTVTVPPAAAATPALTTTDGIRTATMATVASATHLHVCATGLAAGPPTANCGGTVTTLTDKAAAVLFSLGPDATTRSIDETNNQNADTIFTSGTATTTFDDLVTWVSLNTLFDRMGRAGRLP